MLINLYFIIIFPYILFIRGQISKTETARTKRHLFLEWQVYKTIMSVHFTYSRNCVQFLYPKCIYQIRAILQLPAWFLPSYVPYNYIENCLPHTEIHVSLVKSISLKYWHQTEDKECKCQTFRAHPAQTPDTSKI